MSWIVVGSLWPITGTSSTELTVYEVFFTVQSRLLYNAGRLLTISKLNLLHTVRFPNTGIAQESEEFPTIAGIAIRGPATTESRTGSPETSAAGFSALALHSMRGSKTPDHTSLRGLRQMEKKKQKAEQCPGQWLHHISHCCGEQLLSYDSLPLNTFIHLQKASMASSVLKAFTRVPMIPSNKSAFKYVIHLTISQNYLTHIRFLSFLCLQSFFSVCTEFHPHRYNIPT